MSTRKLGVALGAAVLLLGTPMSFALAGQGGEGKGGDKPPHQCEDGLDNEAEPDGKIDYKADGSGDPDCGSPRDNSEGPDEDETPEQPGELPGLPEELQEIVDQVTGALGGEEPCESEPCEGEEPPALPDPGTLPADPATLPGQLRDAVQALLDEVPAEADPVKQPVQELFDQVLPPA